MSEVKTYRKYLVNTFRTTDSCQTLYQCCILIHVLRKGKVFTSKILYFALIFFILSTVPVLLSKKYITNFLTMVEKMYTHKFESKC